MGIIRYREWEWELGLITTCWFGLVLLWSDVAQGVRHASLLAVGGLPVQSHPGRVEVSLSKTPNPQLVLTSWLVPCMAPIAVGV